MNHSIDSIKNAVKCAVLQKVFHNDELEIIRERFDRTGVSYLLLLLLLANNCAYAIFSRKRFYKNAVADMARDAGNL
ncbi:NAD(P)-binding protein [Alternaria alternata]|nr:NAD(P)-binding protein [Alternaria alternata]